MKKKIFVTGSEGFIGSHLVEALVKKNYYVTCLVLYNSFNNPGWLKELAKSNKRNFKLIFGDIRDPEQLRDILKKQDVVINLAALIGIPYSYKSVRSYFETNVMGLINILEASKSLNLEKIIHVSTSEVFGNPKYIPIDENHNYFSQSPYAASKASADQLALSYFNSFSLPITIIRPFNTFGPRQSLRAVIPTLITQYLNNNKNIKIGSLFPVRDLTYIDDTVDAFLKVIQSKKNLSGMFLNLGSGFGISVGNLNLKISKLLGVKKKIVLDKKRIRPKKSEVNILISSNKKIKKILGWKLKYNKKNFDKALIKTINWFKDEKNLKEYNSKKYTI